MRVHRRAALAVLCLAVGLVLLLSPVRLDQARAAGSEEQRLLDLMNGYRQENNVGPLVFSEELTAAAQRHSEDMLDRGSPSHKTGGDSYYPGGSAPADRMAREGYPADIPIAENIAWGQLTAEEVFEDWRRSPGHDATMLDEQYTAVGIGHAGSYWTADFGSVTGTPPEAGQLVEPTIKDQSPPLQPATEGETQPEETAPGSEPADESALRTTSPIQPDAEGTAVEQYAAQTGEAEPVRPSEGGVMPRPVLLAPPDAGSTAPAPPASGETGPAKAPRGPDSGTAVGDPGPTPAAPEPHATLPGEGVQVVSPVDSEAMETVLAAREAVPESLTWQASPTLEASKEAAPAAGSDPVASPLAGSGGDVADVTPVATKRSPGAPPLTLFLGVFLLLGGMLVHGAINGPDRSL